MLGFLIANLVASFIMGDGMMHMWFLINQLQIIYFIPLMNINFHTNAKFVFSLLVFAMADFLDQIPQYFDTFIHLKDLNDRPYNTRYLSLNIDGVYITTCYY